MLVMSRREEWIEDVDRMDRMQRLQREWGFKFQVAAEALLQKMGYEVIRAQHRIFTSLGKRRRGWEWYAERLGDYLWNYADYVVSKEGRLYIIDIKSQGYVPGPKGNPKEHSVPEEVYFTRRERMEYSKARVPVLILLILFRWGGWWERLKGCGLPVGWIVHYDDAPNVKKLGPIRYKILPFAEFRFRDETSGGTILGKFEHCRRIPSKEIYKLLQRTGALSVVEIGLSYLKKENSGRIVINGPHHPYSV